jgi:hypothetical protein
MAAGNFQTHSRDLAMLEKQGAPPVSAPWFRWTMFDTANKTKTGQTRGHFKMLDMWS